MDNSITEIGRILQLEDEEEVAIPDAIWKNGADRKLMLVGMLHTEKYYNFEALRLALHRFLNPGKGMSVQRLEENRFSITFIHPIDRKRALEGGPWIFDKQLIVMNYVADNEKEGEVNLDWCEFTIFIHDLPHEQRTKEMARYIGEILGQYCTPTDKMSDHIVQNSSFIKIRVRLNIHKPLRRWMKLRSPKAEEYTIWFAYARLPNFCFICGKMGHIAKFYSAQYEEGFMGREQPLTCWPPQQMYPPSLDPPAWSEAPKYALVVEAIVSMLPHYGKTEK
ncbi:UNVERIFIED_CONTAM: hypothetical protein Slati_1443500 [Sesamum latifolium]|uniref:DUF4283 domain-containing protein n=1 Tax=Sesamum latifolium TaxID=2727402 RepID=A0AAW2X9M5_9LAMI